MLHSHDFPIIHLYGSVSDYKHKKPDLTCMMTLYIDYMKIIYINKFGTHVHNVILIVSVHMHD